MYVFEYQKKRQRKRRFFIALCIAGCIAIGFSGKIVYDRLAYEEDMLLQVFPSTTEVYFHGRLHGSLADAMRSFIELHPVLIENIFANNQFLYEYSDVLANVSSFSIGIWHNNEGIKNVRMAMVCTSIECVAEKKHLYQGSDLTVNVRDLIVVVDSIADIDMPLTDTLTAEFKKMYFPKSHAWYVYITESGYDWLATDNENISVFAPASAILNDSALFPMMLSLAVYEDILVAVSHPQVLSRQIHQHNALYRFDQKVPFLLIKNLPLSEELQHILRQHISTISPDTMTVPGFFTRLQLESELVGESNIDAVIAPESNLLVIGLRDVVDRQALALQLASYDLPEVVEVDLGSGDVGYEYLAQPHGSLDVYSLFTENSGYESIKNDQKYWDMSYGIVEDKVVFSNTELFWEAQPVVYTDKTTNVLCRSGENAYFNRFLPKQAAQYGLAFFGVNRFGNDILLCLR